MVSSAAITLSCVTDEPVDRAHKVTSSIAARRACWLCRRSVRTSAVAILAWLLSGMSVVVLEGGEEMLVGEIIGKSNRLNNSSLSLTGRQD